MTYSIDFREAVLAHIDSGASIESTSILFSIGTTTIKNWKNLRASTGKLEGAGRPCSPYKIDSEKLKSYVRDNPDAFDPTTVPAGAITNAQLAAWDRALAFQNTRDLLGLVAGIKDVETSPTRGITSSGAIVNGGPIGLNLDNRFSLTSETNKFTVTVDFPTPPLPEPITIIFLIIILVIYINILISKIFLCIVKTILI